MKNRILSFLVSIILLLGACSPTVTQTPTAIPVAPINGLPQSTDGYAWWNDTVFYEIFVRSFYDSDGNGIGDIKGIIAKLDYLKNLGITGLWLMPINPSPSYHGYDITNYDAINPQYGTMDDFKKLLSEAHQRGIRVIIDMVLNHTSDQHPWFIAAQDPQSPYRDYYIWSNTDPGYYGPWGEKVWYQTPTGYYYAIFTQSMPDLNYRNPEVTASMDDVTRFWIKQIGVDGFRLDAVRHLEEEGTNQVNTNSTHAWLQQYFSFYKGLNSNAITVGELAGENAVVMASYIKNKQLDLAFDFNLASDFVNSANNGNSLDTPGQLSLSYSTIPSLQFATFLTNHDQDRLMSRLGNDPNKVKVAASLLLTSPGVPFIYYGEEVGLEGAGQDELKRRPMQWDTTSYAGFSTTIPWESVGPDYQTYNVATETADLNSILSHYQDLIHLRNEHAALRVGSMNLLSTNNSGLFADLRISQNEAVLVLINLSKSPISTYKLSISSSTLAAGAYLALPMLGTGPFANLTVAANGGFSGYIPISEVPAYGTVMMQLHLTEKE
jgi:alpha-amylase